MQEELYDIERSIANGKLYFLSGKDKNNFRITYFSTIIALVVIGICYTIIGIPEFHDTKPLRNETFLSIAISTLGLIVLSFGLFILFRGVRIRSIKGSSDPGYNFEAVQLALEKADYTLVESTDRCIHATKLIRYEGCLYFHGFIKGDQVYFKIYKEHKGVSLLSSFFKSIGDHEFEEFYNHALKHLKNQQKR